MSEGKVILIGAGCGDCDLITLRGREWLKRCDCVIYDALIDRRLLGYAPENAEKICVGKRSGRHSETQKNINRLLVEKASAGLTVARLKGGDPFIFGRGGEEILALKNAGIKYAIVPGISSSSAAPELAGIPVTNRGEARSFHVITGRTGDGLAPDDIAKYAQLDGTLVFLMGLDRIDGIARALIDGGMHGDTPAAVISQGATADQKTVRAPLSQIADSVKANGLKTPAVIVVGKTAAHDFSPTLKLPLSGVRICVTGTKRFAEKLSERLKTLGADITTADFLTVREYAENAAFDDALTHIGRYGWAVLTSVNGADIFFSRLKRLGIDLRQTAHLKFAAIGSGTANALAERGIFADLIPETYTSADLANALCGAVKPSERILIARAENGSHELSDILDSNNIPYDDIKTYAVVDGGADIGLSQEYDFITFASASGVNAYFARGARIPDGAMAVCIGEVTAKALAAHGVSGFRTAAVQNTEGITDTILQEAGK